MVEQRNEKKLCVLTFILEEKDFEKFEVQNLRIGKKNLVYRVWNFSIPNSTQTEKWIEAVSN
ncbi:hypothetical protein ACTXT7_009765 [Hymenolepis weldensis]